MDRKFHQEPSPGFKCKEIHGIIYQAINDKIAGTRNLLSGWRQVPADKTYWFKEGIGLIKGEYKQGGLFNLWFTFKLKEYSISHPFILTDEAAHF